MALPAFTSIGCYTILYVTSDSDCLCAACATDHEGALTSGTYDEGETLQCDECNADIESSYGPCSH